MCSTIALRVTVARVVPVAISRRLVACDEGACSSVVLQVSVKWDRGFTPLVLTQRRSCRQGRPDENSSRGR